MGTHPIFESDFDCLTDEMAQSVSTKRSCASATSDSFVTSLTDSTVSISHGESQRVLTPVSAVDSRAKLLCPPLVTVPRLLTKTAARTRKTSRNLSLTTLPSLMFL